MILFDSNDKLIQDPDPLNPDIVLYGTVSTEREKKMIMIPLDSGLWHFDRHCV